jgi:hypothetical protein
MMAVPVTAIQQWPQPPLHWEEGSRDDGDGGGSGAAGGFIV